MIAVAKLALVGLSLLVAARQSSVLARTVKEALSSSRAPVMVEFALAACWIVPSGVILLVALSAGLPLGVVWVSIAVPLYYARRALLGFFVETRDRA